MNPTAAALRDFAKAARHSPEPAQSVADLANLLADLSDQAAPPVPLTPVAAAVKTATKKPAARRG